MQTTEALDELEDHLREAKRIADLLDKRLEEEELPAAIRNYALRALGELNVLRKHVETP